MCPQSKTINQGLDSDIGGDCPDCHPARLATSTAHQWQNPPKVLHADESGPDWKQNWNYHAVVGCLNYIQAITHPNLSYAVHQCTRFCNTPKLSP